MLESGADTVVSVVAVPHNFNPVSVMRLDDAGWLVPFISGEMILRRQEKPSVFARNGPAILVVRRAVLETGTLYGDKVLPYEMDRTASIDIDDLQDLEMAEFWFQYQEQQRRLMLAQEMVRMARQVVFIASRAHSGSTLLNLLLSGHPRLVALGEVFNLFDFEAGHINRQDKILCSCGETMSRCKFWGPLTEQLRALPSPFPR